MYTPHSGSTLRSSRSRRWRQPLAGALLVFSLGAVALPVDQSIAPIEESGTGILYLVFGDLVAKNAQFDPVVKAVNARDMDEAKRLLEGLRENEALHPTFWELDGTIALIEGRAQDAERSLRNSLDVASGQPAVIAKLGAALYAQHKDDEAREVLEQAYGINPYSVFALQYLARVAVRSGDGAVAGEYYRKAVELSVGGFGPLHREYVAFLLRSGNPQEAQTFLASFSGAKAPEGLDLLRLRAALAAGDAETARSAFDAWSKGASKAEREAVQFYSAQVDRLSGELERAEQTLRKLQRANPDSAVVAYELAQTLERQGNTAAALEEAAKVAGDASAGAGLRLDAAELFLRNGKPGEAQDVLQSVPEDRRDADYLVLLVRATAMGGDIAGAETIAARLTKEYPRYPLGYQLHAQLLQTLGKSKEARAVAAAATEQSPDSLTAWTSRAGLLIGQQRLDEALSVTAEGLKQHPDNAALRFQAANVKQMLGRNREAEADYRLLLEDPSTRLPSLNNLANLLSSQPARRAEALQYAQQAHALAPASPAIQDTLGWMYYLNGRADESLAHLGNAYQQASMDAETVCHFGIASAEVQGDGAATKLLQRCIELNPPAALASLARAKLGQ